jgi:LPS sulfotransferase NodH
MKSSPFRYFVLLADMRTGSNLFESSISLYDDIECYGELFNPQFIGGPKRASLPDLKIEVRDADPIAAIEHMIAQNPTQLSGFRLFPNHNKKVLDHVLLDESCAKIVLRRNPLDSFVSHQIAKETDQWLLRDLAVRREAKVKFDIDKFQTYLEKRNCHRDFVDRSILESGQAVCHINYEDMARVETFNGVVSYLGVEQQMAKLTLTTKRQNPAGLRDKVTNYEEMRATLSDLNIFESDKARYLEPSKTKGSISVHVGRTAPIMYFPITHDPLDPILLWMRSVESDGQLPRTKLKGRELLDWLSAQTDRIAITSLEHPVERAYRAFNDRIVFLPPEKNKWIRRVLVGQYGLELPNWPAGETPVAADLVAEKYTPALHAKNFTKFLHFIRGNLRGQTRASVDPYWCSQHLVIEGYHRWTFPNFVIRPDQRPAILSLIQDLLGLNPADVLQQRKTDLISLSDVYTNQIEISARSAYETDYQKFGFHDWKPGD